MDSVRWQHIRQVFERCLDFSPAERDVYLDEVGRIDLECRNEVEALLEAHANAASFLEDSLSAETLQALDLVSEGANIGARIGSYRILQKIGQGGMGTVYLAERADGYFERQVAIKLVDKAVYRTDLVDRFGEERRILASLNHPNIARLLDGGVTESGIPYLVMEFVKGTSLLDHCNAYRLALDERLRLFQTVCDAVHHAHQNLIIHRDLKPSNILVTSRDVNVSSAQIKLLDFGVATLLTSSVETGSPENPSEQRLMTLAYASPEQLKSETVTTASDVYSLGIILYELLSGVRPYSVQDRSLAEIESFLRTSHILSPSQQFAQCEKHTTEAGSDRLDYRNGSLKGFENQCKGDLDSITLKAISPDPDLRYVSVAQFNEDIERYLNKLPVVARSATISYRSTKFFQRHRVGVFIGSLVFLALLASVVVTSHQAQVAERNAGQVRRLANSLLFELNDKVRDVPGATDIRRTLVTHALTYLENLSQQGSPDPSLQLEVAEAYEQAGRIQGDPHYTNLGDLLGSLGSYQKALTIRESVWKKDSSHVPLRIALANNYARLAVVTSWCCDNSEAIRLSNHALSLIEPALEFDSTNVGVRHDLARIESELGWWLIWQGKTDEGLALLEMAVGSLEKLTLKLPKLVEVQHHMWRAYSYQVDGLKFSGQHAKALTLLTEKALPHLNRVVLRYPNHPLLMYDLHIAYLFLGEMQEAEGHFEDSRSSFYRSLFIAEDLAQSDSTNRKALEAVAYGNTALGKALALTGETEASLDHMRKAVAIRLKLFEFDPLNGEVGNAAGNASRALCRAQFDLGRLDEAKETCMESADILFNVVGTSFGGPIVAANYASSCAFTARVFKALFETETNPSEAKVLRETALDWYEKAFTVLKKVERGNEHLVFEVLPEEIEAEVAEIKKSDLL